MVGISSGFLFLSFGYSKNNKERRSDVVSCNLVPITVVVSNMRTVVTGGQKGRRIDYTLPYFHTKQSLLTMSTECWE